MELVIIRTYHPGGTNGTLLLNEQHQCYTIELPWKNNQPMVSCIPEGRYLLKRRYSPKRGHHLLVYGVEGRALILLHPANDALKELKGCIAPVSKITGEGRGERSRHAFNKLLQLVYAALPKETVFINIQSKNDESKRKDAGAHAAVL